MRKLVDLVKLMIRADSRAFRNGLALSIVVLAMGAALLGLSGWFVTAAAAAGLAGIGIGFDFFRPSAGVRFLALGRSAARYGERLVTHDATLRALAALRVTLLGGIARLPHEAQARLRGASALNRLTSDVDALDGLMLRLVLPALAAVAVQLGAAVALWMLVAPAVAVAVLTIYLAGGALVLVQSARKARAAAAMAEDQLQALRAQSLDTLRTRADQVMAGALVARATELRGHVTNEAEARTTLDRVERWGNAAVSMTGGLAASAALAIGGYLAEAEAISAARAAIGFFVALALIETLSQLRRGMAELGRMQVAGARVLDLAQTPELQAPRPPPAPRPGPVLLARDVRFRRPGATRELFSPVSLSLNRGETIVIGGASGTGKSTLLAVLSGLLVPSAGEVLLMGAPLRDWPEDARRARLTMVPQRPQLIGGTIAENLRLALPEGTAADEALMRALDAVDLSDTVSARGGLEMRLGEGGTGLSGGQSKRLALARAALRHPTVLLLDEPTEGLDPDTARATLQGLRALLPDSGFVIVSHRGADLEGAGHAVLLRSATD